MTEGVLVSLQVVAIITYVGTAFWLYRVLVGQKDATIEHLKEHNSILKDQLADAKAERPDELAESLEKRVTRLSAELNRLTQDKEKDTELIRTKEHELELAKDELDTLKNRVLLEPDTIDKFKCPKCNLPAIEYAPSLEKVQAYEDISATHTLQHLTIKFQCGRLVEDGYENAPCQR